jgi:hypothetical protein
VSMPGSCATIDGQDLRRTTLVQEENA